MISTADVYWMAGLMEGEGYFGLRRGKDLVAQVSMTDRDVIERLHSIVRFGSRTKDRLLPSGKTAYGWLVTNQSEAAGFMMMLLPIMGARRAAKIRHCISEWKTKPLPKRQWTHCKSGHALVGENLRIVTEGRYQKRRCMECGRRRQQQYRAAKAA